MLFIASLLALYLWAGRGLPDPAVLSTQLNYPSLRITDRNGRLLYEAMLQDGGRHTVVDLDQVPLDLQNATIATEDRSFYLNPGVDPAGILRAAWINLTGGGTLSGGSTLTQQVARNLLMNSDERLDRSLRRKVRETFLAVDLARRLPKKQVLALYLNQMYYGNLAYGVEAASQTYFGKPVSELDLAEAALIAGLPQSPTAYDPFVHPEQAKARQRIVLSLMEKAGYLSSQQRALAEAEPLVYNRRPYPILAPHFVMMVRAEVQDLALSQEIYRYGGLTVRTTLDLDWQLHAEDAVHHQLARLQQEGQQSVGYNINDAALVAIDPANGQILAMVGSPDYFDERISGAVNMALAPRQPGSALKPLIYADALDPAAPAPWTPATMLLDVSTNFTTHDGKAYTPANYDGLEHGPVLVRQALGSSLNIPAVLTLQHVGMQRLFSLAGSLGITTLGNPDRYDLSLALGGGEVSLLQLTAAYGALADGGARVTPTAILDVRDPQGNVIFTPPAPVNSQVIDPRTAWLVTDILADDGARETGFGLNSVLRIDRPAAVKTGTTTNFNDNWTIGYTPDLVVGVWAGNADHSAMRGVNGLSGAAPIWHEFIRTVLNGRPAREFPRPAGIVSQEICAVSGLLPTPACPNRRQEWFIDGTQPLQPDSIFHQVEVDSATGRLADAGTPPASLEARLAWDLPPAALPWAQANHLLLYSPEESRLPLTGLAALDPSTGAHFLSPPDSAIYRLAPGLERDSQRLLVEVNGAAPDQPVTLWIDGQPVHVFSAAPYEFWWSLETGRHTFSLKVTAPDGSQRVTDTVTVDVK